MCGKPEMGGIFLLLAPGACRLLAWVLFFKLLRTRMPLRYGCVLDITLVFFGTTATMLGYWEFAREFHRSENFTLGQISWRRTFTSRSSMASCRVLTSLFAPCWLTHAKVGEPFCVFCSS
jgi:hypothetical protein